MGEGNHTSSHPEAAEATSGATSGAKTDQPVSMSVNDFHKHLMCTILTLHAHFRPRQGHQRPEHTAAATALTSLPSQPHCQKRQVNDTTSDQLSCKIESDLANQGPFKSGAIARHISVWENLTSDRSILATVTGFQFDFDCAPVQTLHPKQLLRGTHELAIADSLLQELLIKDVIEPTTFHPKGYISNIFLREKKNGDYRLILNLKTLNQFVEYHHFKMENFTSALTLITKDCYLASLDLSDAYYSVPVAPHHRKYLQFSHNGSSFRFTCLANGVSSAPRTFTKLMKIPLSHLREHYGITVTSYLDDLLLVAQTEADLLKALDTTQTLLRSLGFIISVKKSSVKPAQQMTYLGFVINSQNMTVSLSNDKAIDIKTILQSALTQTDMSIRQYAGVLGKIAATLPANKYGQLHLKLLEQEKTKALYKHKFSYEGIIPLTEPMREEINWWIKTIESVSRPIYQPKPDFQLFTDASFLGWGCYIPSTKQKTGGRWGVEDHANDINFLELKAVLLSLKSCCSSLVNNHIRINSDNTSTVVGINRQGSTQSYNCNIIVQQIWAWAIPLHIWLSAAHCPGVLNVEADEASRVFNDNTEWQIDKSLFQDLCRRFGTPEVDLFASRLNYQVAKYCAWQPDPGAMTIDCFSIDWNTFNLTYAFPPFSLTGRVLQKISMDRAEAIIIAPQWPTQAWYSKLLSMATDQPMRIRVSPSTLRLPHNPTQPHPLAGRLTLLACKVSGQSTSRKASIKTHQKS